MLTLLQKKFIYQEVLTFNIIIYTEQLILFQKSVKTTILTWKGVFYIKTCSGRELRIECFHALSTLKLYSK